MRSGALLLTTSPAAVASLLSAKNCSSSDGVNGLLPCHDRFGGGLESARRVRIHREARAADGFSGGDVARRVAHQVRAAQIEAEVLRALTQHQRARLAALAAVCRGVRAAIPSEQRRAALDEPLLHAAHDADERFR